MVCKPEVIIASFAYFYKSAECASQTAIANKLDIAGRPINVNNQRQFACLYTGGGGGGFFGSLRIYGFVKLKGKTFNEKGGQLDRKSRR